MTPERWQQVDTLFQAAIERPAVERAAFLEAACAGDPELRRQVEALLAAHDRADSFLEPARRYASVEQLSEDIGRHLDGRPVLARKATLAYRSGKYIKRNQTKIMAAALVGMTALVVLLVLAVWFYYFPRPVLPFAERDWVLVADFTNQTGEGVFDKALEQALTMSLEQSPYCNLYPREKVRESLKRMRRDRERVDENLGREICQREGIRALLLGDIDTLDGTYLLTAKVVDAGAGKVVKTIMVRAKGKTKVLDGVEELATQVRRSLGEALPSIDKSNKKLEQVTTSSLEALKSYSLGVEQNSNGACREAISLFKTAVELDPSFASAYRSLAGAYRNCRNISEARNYSGKAFELKEKVTEREKHHIQALYYFILGQYEQAIDWFRLLVKLYPDDLVGHANLGALYYELGQFNKGIEESREALRIHPDATTYADMALAYLYLSNYDESIKHAFKALESTPQNSIDGLMVLALDYLGKGEIEKAKEQCKKMMASEDVQFQIKGQERLMTVLTHQGKVTEAMSALHGALMLNEKYQLKPSLAQDHILMATLYDLKGVKQKLVKELNEVLDVMIQAENEYLYLLTLAVAGKWYARNGYLDKAQNLVDKLREKLKDEKNNQKKVLSDLVWGEIERARKNYNAAITSLQTASAYPTQYSYFQVRESLASAYFAAGDYDKAVSEYETAIKQKGWTLNYFMGLPHYWVTAHYWLARAYEQKGLAQKAVENYQKFLDLWKEADANLPWLQDAKVRLKRLKTG